MNLCAFLARNGKTSESAYPPERRLKSMGMDCRSDNKGDMALSGNQGQTRAKAVPVLALQSDPAARRSSVQSFLNSDGPQSAALGRDAPPLREHSAPVAS